MVHEWITSIHGFTRFIMAQTWGKSSPSLIVLSMISHGGYIGMSFGHGIPKLEVSKLLKLGFPSPLRAIISCVNLRLKWDLKQNFSPRWKLSNNMWHANCTHVFQGDFELLLGGNQIDTLILNPFLGHNLYFKYWNGSCEPILRIYVSRAFQWFKKIFNPISFGPWNTFLKTWNSIGIPTPKMWESIWKFMGSFIHILESANVIPMLHSWPTPFHAFALVINPR